jgi:hypothetical protein
MNRRPTMRDSKQILTNIESAQALPLVDELGDSLSTNGPYALFQASIPATATATVKFFGRVNVQGPWQELEAVTISGVRAHLATPYVTARVTSYAGTGQINVWVVRDGL